MSATRIPHKKGRKIINYDYMFLTRYWFPKKYLEAFHESQYNFDKICKRKKVAMENFGFEAGDVRAPLQELSEADRQKVINTFTRNGFLR